MIHGCLLTTHTHPQPTTPATRKTSPCFISIPETGLDVKMAVSNKIIALYRSFVGARVGAVACLGVSVPVGAPSAEYTGVRSS